MALTAAALLQTSSLTCLQLVFKSNWSNFWHAFASRGFVSVSWTFCLLTLSPTDTHSLTKTAETARLVDGCTNAFARTTDSAVV